MPLRHVVPILTVLLAGAASGPAVETGPGTDRADEPGIAESVLVRRVHLPVLIQPARGRARSGGACEELAPGDVRLTWNGERLPVAAVGPRPLPRTHALLIDTSRSMVDRLDDAREAAEVYLDGLPADDRVLVASFDESLVLGTPPTLDRGAALDAVRSLRAGTYTALWDALYYLVAYVETLPGEKVILVLTDGEDSSSLRAHRFDVVVERAATAANLVVFPVGLGLPAVVGTGVATARGRLGRLAERTGGEFFESGSAAGLTPVFRRIRRRLDGMRYVSFSPPDPDDGPPRQVEVRLRVEGELPCRIVPLRGRQGIDDGRHAGATADLDRSPMESLDTPWRSAAAAASCLTGEPATALVAALSLPENQDETAAIGPAATLFSGRERAFLSGRVTDFAVERGPSFRAGSFRHSGRLRPTFDRKPVFVRRNVAIATPPVEDVVSRIRNPVDLLRYMLERDLCAPVPVEEDPYDRAPFLVHGQTFLELRELIGRAVYSERSDYRAWASDRAVRRAADEVAALRHGLPEAGDLPPGVWDDLEAALAERAGDPGRGRPHGVLSEWLGDVQAWQVARDLDSEMCDRLLLAEDGGGAGPDRGDAIASRWHRIEAWFPPALGARILAPLIPVYDAARESIGYYRFVLEWPQRLERAPTRLPPSPLGYDTLRWLRDRGSVGEAAGTPIGVVAVRYDEADRGTFRKVGCREDPASGEDERHSVPRPDASVEISVARRDGSTGGADAIVTAFYAVDRATAAIDGPLCVVVAPAPGADGAGRGIARRLARFVEILQ